MKKTYFLTVLFVLFIILNSTFFLEKKFEEPSFEKYSSATFILPYKNKLWMVNNEGKIFDLIQSISEFQKTPILKIPKDFIDEKSGTISLAILKYIPQKVPTIVYEINLEDNSFILLNNAKIFFEDIEKLAIYFENIKILYKYTESNAIYYIKDDMLIKVR
ncbi:DUF4894 domain-containing protein [Thermosipho atlanticus]|nr:DUF4894 domain-containing protein [Thermosipho atlanticus]